MASAIRARVSMCILNPRENEPRQNLNLGQKILGRSSSEQSPAMRFESVAPAAKSIAKRARATSTTARQDATVRRSVR